MELISPIITYNIRVVNVQRQEISYLAYFIVTFEYLLNTLLSMKYPIVLASRSDLESRNRNHRFQRTAWSCLKQKSSIMELTWNCFVLPHARRIAQNVAV